MYPLGMVLVGFSQELLEQLEELPAQEPALVVGVYDNVSTALDELKTAESKPKLLLCALSQPGQVDELRRLRAAYPRWPLIAVVEPDVKLVIQATGAGSDRVLTQPLHADEFRDTLRKIGKNFAINESAPRGTVIATTTTEMPLRDANSAEEGLLTGAELIYRLALHGASSQQLRTIIVDMDPSQQTELPWRRENAEAWVNRDNAWSKSPTPDNLRERLISLEERLWVLPHPARNDRAVFADTLSVVSSLARMVFLYYPWSDLVWVDGITELANQAMIVGAQSVASVRRLRLFNDTLERVNQQQNSHTRLHVLLSDYDPELSAFSLTRVKPMFEKADVWACAPVASGTLDLSSISKALVSPRQTSAAQLGSSRAFRWLFKQFRSH